MPQAWSGPSAGGRAFETVEGALCRTGLLDGPAALAAALLACGGRSRATIAAVQVCPLTSTASSHVTLRLPLCVTG